MSVTTTPLRQLRFVNPLRARTPEAAEVAIHGAILRLVSIAEEFSLGRLIDATEPALPLYPSFLKALWETELNISSGTWPGRMGAWKRLHEIEISATFPAYNALDGYIAARNIVAHGLGYFTRKQLRKPAGVINQLKSADIAVQGNMLVLEPRHVEACAEVTRLFVDWLDVTAPRPY